MKFSIAPFESQGYRYVRAQAVIPKSSKTSQRRFQKTWKVRCVAPEFTIKNEGFIFENEANRWESRIMDKIKRETELMDRMKSRDKDKPDIVP